MKTRILGVFTLATACLVAAASTSWACFAAQYPSTSVTPNRFPSPSEVTVAGDGWAPTISIALYLSPDGASVLQPLPAATASAGGTFVSRVRLTDVTPGVYYLVATQGASKQVTAVEVTGQLHSQLAPAWGGQTSGNQPPPSDGSGLPLAPFVFAGAVALVVGGWALTGARRRATA